MLSVTDSQWIPSKDKPRLLDCLCHNIGALQEWVKTASSSLLQDTDAQQLQY